MVKKFKQFFNILESAEDNPGPKERILDSDFKWLENYDKHSLKVIEHFLLDMREHEETTVSFEDDWQNESFNEERIALGGPHPEDKKGNIDIDNPAYLKIRGMAWIKAFVNVCKKAEVPREKLMD